MDAFTMVIVACIAGEPQCISAQFSDNSFTTFEACDSRINEVASSMTKDFAKRHELKGKQVTYEVTCSRQSKFAKAVV
jgi:hypothetical protein